MGYAGFRRGLHRKAVGLSDPRERAMGAHIRAQHRHNVRPAHIHFMIHKVDYKKWFSHLYSADDTNLETAVQFGTESGVDRSLRSVQRQRAGNGCGCEGAVEFHCSAGL
jgi:hypothetical protein